MRVAIIGAGVTGLTAAYLLLRDGVDVDVYEASPHEGGLAGSFRRDGFSFDFGPHEFCTDDSRLIELLREVCGDDLLDIEKRVAQYFNARYLEYPFKPIDVLRNLPTSLAARAVLEAGVLRLRALVKRPAESCFEDWTLDRFGRTLYEAYFGPYTEKVWGLPPADLDADVARQRITVDSVWGLIKKTLAYRFRFAEDWKHTHSEFRHRFFYVRRGMGTLMRALREATENAGGKLHFGRRLVAAEHDGTTVRALRFEGGDAATAHDAVISTIPLPHLVTATLGDQGRGLVADNELPFRGMVFCFLRIARPELLGYHWVYFPGAEIPFQRLTEFGRFDADMAPPGHTGLTVEIASNPGEEFWDAGDAEVVERTCVALSRLGVLSRNDVVGADVVRVRHAYPLQVRGYAARTARLLDALRPLTNLVTLGRQGLYRYCNMNECMEMALDVAPRIARGEAGVRCELAGTWTGVSVGFSDRGD